MKNTFDPKEHLRKLGIRLVHDFESAGDATHPGAVGSGREKPARDNLRRILPVGVGVGSGFVIDSFGETSNQCDIIIYEEQFALKFTINDDDQYAYYNCENVIAVGQVKSDASIQDVRDAIENLQSVRKLKRYRSTSDADSHRNGYSYRCYLNNMSMGGVAEQAYNPDIKASDQIFTFLLCKSFKTPPLSIFNEIDRLCGRDRRLFPNRLLSIEGDYCFWFDVENGVNCVKYGALDGKCFTRQKVDYVFGQLVTELINFISIGRSVRLCNSIYLPSLEGLAMSGDAWFINENINGGIENA